MRRVDEDPGPRGRGVRGRLLVPLVVAGAAAVVLSTAAEGPARFTPPSFGGAAAEQEPLPSPPAASAPPPPDPIDSSISAIVQTVLLVLAALIALVVVIALVRLLVRAIRGRRPRIRALRLDSAGADVATADAPAVLRGIAAALAALDEDRVPGDAVVRAWLGLQQAAEDAGLARSPAETPTEFTSRVLSRTGADRAALGDLLRLYLRARFDDGAITAADTGRAREALRAVEASWTRATASSRG